MNDECIFPMILSFKAGCRLSSVVEASARCVIDLASILVGGGGGGNKTTDNANTN